MLDIDIEYKKGVLFVRLSGQLSRNTYRSFEINIIPLVIYQGISKIVINLDEINYIDEKGISSLKKLSKVINSEITLCTVKREIKDYISNYFKAIITSNELKALRVNKV